MIRWQLPVHSPLTLGGIVGAAFDVAGGRGQARSALEAQLTERFRADGVVLVQSGTHALQLALGAADVRRPVALPGYTCFDVATAALGAGVSVMFYDLDPESLTPDLDGVRMCLERGCGAVVVNSLSGFPVDWTALRRECDDHGALLIEDAAQAGGSEWQGRPAGTFGDLSVLSFGRGKGWTGGAGGALLSRGNSADQRNVLLPGQAASGWRAFIVSSAQWVLGRPGVFGIPRSVPGLGLGETHFRPPDEPRGMPSYVAASVLRHQDAARAEIPIRRRNAAEWRRVLDGRAADAGVRVCVPLEESWCGYLRLPVVASGAAAERLRSTVVVKAGVARGYPTALPDLRPLQGALSGSAPNLPGARALAQNLHTFPTHSLVSRKDFEVLLEAFSPPGSL